MPHPNRHLLTFVSKKDLLYSLPKRYQIAKTLLKYASLTHYKPGLLGLQVEKTQPSKNIVANSKNFKKVPVPSHTITYQRYPQLIFVLKRYGCPFTMLSYRGITSQVTPFILYLVSNHFIFVVSNT